MMLIPGSRFTLTDDWTTIVGTDKLSNKFINTFSKYDILKINELAGKLNGYGTGIAINFCKDTIFEITNYVIDGGFSHVILKVLWTPLKPRQNTTYYTITVAIANFNPIVKIVKNNAVPSEDIFNIQPGEVLSTSELWAYVGRNVFVEQKDGTNTPALLTVNKVYHYLKNEVIIINSVVVSCPSFVATIEFDKDENSLIQDVLFSNFQKIGKHLLTIRKPKL